jgi:hypothetical protein
MRSGGFGRSGGKVFCLSERDKVLGELSPCGVKACLGQVWYCDACSPGLTLADTATEYGLSGGGGAGFLVGLRTTDWKSSLCKQEYMLLNIPDVFAKDFLYLKKINVSIWQKN